MSGKWFLSIAIMLYSFGLSAQELKEEITLDPNAKIDSTKKSINAAAVGAIGNANVIIRYHSPGVRNRMIWGGVVPYDEVWVTGAHNATTLEVDRSFAVGGKTIEAGKYALFTIPGKTTWTFIINKNWDQHLTDDYNAKDDIIRIPVTPIQPKKKLERLQYFVRKEANTKGVIAVGWDKLMIELPITIF